MKITDANIVDLRFPTSRQRDGSDAMNPDPDYSAAYVILETDQVDMQGHGMTFTIGRGNELCVAAIESLLPSVIGKELDELTTDMAGFWRQITSDSQLRWLGPEKGIIHMSTAAIVNAVWDLWARQQNKPLWKLVADMSPEQIISCIDFRYITDALTPTAALQLLQQKNDSRSEREDLLLQTGYPAYTTSAGWLGYDDDKLRALCRQSIEQGWQYMKLKVGGNIEQDQHRLEIVREVVGDDMKIMIDANQVWDVDQAIEWVNSLSRFQPLFIEEPTNPDDVLGHKKIRDNVKPVGVATGEHCHNRIMFKQFFQAEAIDYCQLDSCRLGGVNEVLAVLLLAAKFNIPVWPHAGGVGLCEYVQHLSMIDFICVSGTMDNRVIEYVDHLHEHFIHPCIIKQGRYMPPLAAGYSIQVKSQSLQDYAFPDGRAWQ
ncbi:MAG: L-fuconate dehydratase [Gammaproteobacteria bacterium]|jgi:L-fuconate dehydratase